MLAGPDVGPHQVGDGLRQRRRRLCQSDGDGRLVVGDVVGDVVDGEANDAADGLRIEENEGGGDAGSQWQGVVVEDPAEHREPAVLVQRFRVLGDDGGR
ncbi:hypothetical protein ACFTXB_01615 [Streptomyces sp. NPDC057074]|uniref:hypothetical protein n=1 Tax=Streptomyces sp. NPDC057074 TaxID=3346015 RepID=UPI0036341A16